ncbi:hypothetical protein GDO81_022951 [Engystomops pustulosus]|uniref:NADH dehydrogenase subunit 6 n=1 Tax=Engystomops pustulosus TaxID=76066 RepID=A0AAV6ZTS7_ENGPU|nr:hypothetical protein GDO81_022951 [Engystomops pustulosus]
MKPLPYFYTSYSMCVYMYMYIYIYIYIYIYKMARACHARIMQYFSASVSTCYMVLIITHLYHQAIL